MAHEGRRRQSMSISNNDPQERHAPIPHRPSTNVTSAPPFPPPPLQQSNNSQDGRASPSNTRRYLREAVSTVFDKNAPPEQSSAVHPDLVAAITKEVIQNLKASGLAGLQPVEPPTSGHPPPRDVYTPPSPERHEAAAAPPQQQQQPHYDGMNERNGGARYLERSSTPPVVESDTTTLEKIWQPLFEENGEPTARLGQFLRGLAIHIIEDYEPKNSLVIPPHKMVKFYEETKVNDEIYPWNSIFGGKMTMSSISHLYRDLSCQHHFIQTRFDDKPSTPALTPLGFQIWMTSVIRAHPDKEFDRFAKAVMAMPISNFDNRKERFPKQLPRKLFPSHANHKIYEHLEDSILADPVIELPRKSSTSHTPQQPPNHNPSTSAQPTSPPKHPPAPPSYANKTERERKPLSEVSSDPALRETNPSISIERERKPYYAQPGQGKNYESDDNGCLKPDSNYLARSNTVSSSTRPTQGDTGDEGSGYSRRYRSGSTAAYQGTPRRRARSPSSSAPISHGYSRSESDAAPNSHSSASSTVHGDHEDDVQKNYSRDSRRYVPEDGSRSHAHPPPPLPQQQQQQQGYEPEQSRPARQNSMQPNYQFPQQPPPPSQPMQQQQQQQQPYRY